MHDQRKPAGETLVERPVCHCFEEKLPSPKEKTFKARPVGFNEKFPSFSTPFTDFNRYSFPLSPCSPSGRPTKTFKEVINDNIHAQRQEKRAVSLMPEILLHAAVLDNNVDEIVKLLKVDGIDLNRGAKMGLFSLHEAAFSGLEQVTEILVVNGADVNMVTPEGLTPLDAAVCAGNFECAEILIKNGAPIDSIKNGFVDRSF